jgi:hypothetical protein
MPINRHSSVGRVTLTLFLYTSYYFIVLDSIPVRHPRQRRWLDEWDRLKDDRTMREFSD